jgi:hypothetical protein
MFNYVIHLHGCNLAGRNFNQYIAKCQPISLRNDPGIYQLVVVDPGLIAQIVIDSSLIH